MLKRGVFFLLACVLVVCGAYLMTRPTKKNEPKGPKESISPIVIRSAYEEGYWKGYGAFLSQSGLKLPPVKLVKYSSSDSEEQKEESERGYVDGYHKATESVSCPSH